MTAKQSEIRLKKFMRLKNQNKEANHVLQKDYIDDDIEEYEEQLSETYVSCQILIYKILNIVGKFEAGS